MRTSGRRMHDVAAALSATVAALITATISRTSHRRVQWCPPLRAGNPLAHLHEARPALIWRAATQAF
eukprot:6960484-Alexandrium_andersonii.AAC.1